MAHVLELRNVDDELVDIVVLCSDFCHRDWAKRNIKKYEGWNGCHEVNETHCANCGDAL